eukprot:scaffold5692_cov74-Phaeocystis_antarctica.AAC.7
MRAITHTRNPFDSGVIDMPKAPTAGKAACRAATGPPAGIRDQTTDRRCPASTAACRESASVGGKQNSPPSPPTHPTRLPVRKRNYGTRGSSCTTLTLAKGST